MNVNALALRATVHCLTGCVIGEVAGMVIGTTAGFSNEATILLAIALAFVFCYALTMLPLLRGGTAFGLATKHRHRLRDRVSVRILANRYLITRGGGHTAAHGHH